MSIWDDLEDHVKEAPEFFKAGLRSADMLHAASIGRAQQSRIHDLEAVNKSLLEKNAVLKEALNVIICQALHWDLSSTVEQLRLQLEIVVSEAGEGLIKARAIGENK